MDYRRGAFTLVNLLSLALGKYFSRFFLSFDPRYVYIAGDKNPDRAVFFRRDDHRHERLLYDQRDHDCHQLHGWLNRSSHCKLYTFTYAKIESGVYTVVGGNNRGGIANDHDINNCQASVQQYEGGYFLENWRQLKQME